jgi:hypothetical protein
VFHQKPNGSKGLYYKHTMIINDFRIDDTFEMRTSVLFRIFIQLITFHPRPIILYQKLKLGKKANYWRERERERVRVRVWVNDSKSVVWKSQNLGKTCVYKKGKNAAGDRLRLMRNMRKIRPSDVSNGQRHFERRTIRLIISDMMPLELSVSDATIWSNTLESSIAILEVSFTLIYIFIYYDCQLMIIISDACTINVS